MLFRTCRHLTFVVAYFGLCSFSLLHPMKSQKKKETLIRQQKSNIKAKKTKQTKEFTFLFTNSKKVTFPLEIAKKLPVIISAMEHTTINENNVKCDLHNEWNCESPDSPRYITPTALQQILDILNKEPTPFILDKSNYKQTCDFFCRSDLKKLALTTQKTRKKYKLPPQISKFDTSEKVAKILVRTNFNVFNALYGLLTPTYTTMFSQKNNSNFPFFKRPLIKLASKLGEDNIEIRSNPKHRKTVYIYDKKTGGHMQIITHNYPVNSISIKNKGKTLVTRTAYEESGWNLENYPNKEATISGSEALLIHLLTKTNKKITEGILNLPIKTIWQTIPHLVQKKLLKEFAYRLPKDL